MRRCHWSSEVGSRWRMRYRWTWATYAVGGRFLDLRDKSSMGSKDSKAFGSFGVLLFVVIVRGWLMILEDSVPHYRISSILHLD